MSDEQLRDLERRSAGGDVDATARLVMLNRKVYGPRCGHWLQSMRFWVAAGGVQRNDPFCLYCGMNLAADMHDDDLKPVYWDDCGGRVARQLRKDERDRLARMAEDEAERVRRDAEDRARLVATLKSTHDWLADVDDDKVLDLYDDVTGGGW